LLALIENCTTRFCAEDGVNVKIALATFDALARSVAVIFDPEDEGTGMGYGQIDLNWL
jgi:hypothetical protein